MEDPVYLARLVAICAFALAFVFGWVASRSHFCTMGAVSDIVNIGDWSRMRTWMLAVCVAIVCTNVMVIAGWIDLTRSLYVGERLMWLSHLVGGFLFGVGMTIASGCGARNLIRLGGGNLKSLVVLLLLGLSAYMTMKGVFAPLRANLLDTVAVTIPGGQALPDLLSRLLSTGSTQLRVALTLVLALGLLAFVLADDGFRRNRQQIASGAVIGLIVAGGWYVTAKLGYLAEDPNTLTEAYVGTNTRRPESFTFVGPVAYGLELLLLWTDASLRITFGIAAVLGLALGAFVCAAVTRQFRWEGFTSAADMRSHVLGGILMGFGGVLALGCTIGQGITGVSTLAIGSFLTLFALIAGCVATLKWLYWRME